MIFVEAPRSIDELRAVGARIPGPLLVNVIEGGLTPQLTFEAYAAMGFRVILYPTSAVRVAAHALTSFYERLQRDRSSADAAESLVSFDERNRINDLATYLGLEQHYAVGTTPLELERGARVEPTQRAPKKSARRSSR